VKEALVFDGTWKPNGIAEVKRNSVEVNIINASLGSK
jgi:hypothetical protein